MKISNETEGKVASISPPLKDPIVALPPEMFSQLISFLRPQGIATSSAICRTWKESFHSNPTLHTEVDLSQMGLASEMDRVLKHFR